MLSRAFAVLFAFSVLLGAIPSRRAIDFRDHHRHGYRYQDGPNPECHGDCDSCRHQHQPDRRLQ